MNVSHKKCNLFLFTNFSGPASDGQVIDSENVKR